MYVDKEEKKKKNGREKERTLEFTIKHSAYSLIHDTNNEID
jgi:hypothetical protein